jgi:hypothetical protein
MSSWKISTATQLHDRAPSIFQEPSDRVQGFLRASRITSLAWSSLHYLSAVIPDKPCSPRSGIHFLNVNAAETTVLIMIGGSWWIMFDSQHRTM